MSLEVLPPPIPRAVTQWGATLGPASSVCSDLHTLLAMNTPSFYSFLRFPYQLFKSVIPLTDLYLWGIETCYFQIKMYPALPGVSKLSEVGFGITLFSAWLTGLLPGESIHTVQSLSLWYLTKGCPPLMIEMSSPYLHYFSSTTWIPSY